MSIRNVQQNSLAQRHMSAPRQIVRVPSSSGFTAANGTWRRNPAWLAMPSVLITDQKIVVLTAVRPISEFVAFRMSGNYTVDWGDGSAPVNVNSGVTAQYLYDYSVAGLDNTDGPVTFTDVGDLVTRTAHGYENGDIVTFWTVVTTTGVTVGQQYYVINKTTDTFQISLTDGGTAVALTNDGSGTLLPYKQAIITITPQVGQNLTSVNFQFRHTSSGTSIYSTGYLDMTMSCPNATSIVFGANTNDTFAVVNRMLEQATVLTIGSTTNLTNLFRACTSLVNMPLFDTSSVTNMTGMFYTCLTLRNVPLFNTSNVTSFASFFRDCQLLEKAPAFDTQKATNMFAMFSSCRELTSVPFYDTSKVTSVNSMFFQCYSLQSVPLFNTQVVTDMGGFLQRCYSLQSVPLFNTANVTNMQSILDGCLSIEAVPPFNTSKVTNMRLAFTACASITTFPLLDTSLVTNMSAMLSGCTTLKSIPLLNTSNATNMSGMFSQCLSLESVPPLDTSKNTNMQEMFRNCQSLRSVPLLNTANVTDTQYCFLGNFNLTSVPPFNMSKVTLSQLMFEGCSTQSYPLFDLSKVTSANGMFNGNNNLQKIPLFDTSKMTNVSLMFRFCPALTEIPAFDFNAVTSSAGFLNLFQGSPSISRIQATGFKFTFSVADLKLGGPQLDEIYTNLPTVVGQTITVTGNYGTTADNPSIATAKGWTVVG